MDFIKLGLAGTKCGSSNPRQRLCAVTCFPPTNWATEARSVNDVATFKSANAGAAASTPSSDISRLRISDFMESSKVLRDVAARSVRMGRVVPDRVAHL